MEEFVRQQNEKRAKLQKPSTQFLDELDEQLDAYKQEQAPQLKVAHDQNDLKDQTSEVILTLKDERILNDRGRLIAPSQQDTLLNEQMAQDYKKEYQKKLNDKIKKKDFDNTDEFFKSNLLPQYDEHNPEKEGFIVQTQEDQLTQEQKMLLSIQSKLGVSQRQSKGQAQLDERVKTALDGSVDKKEQSDYFGQEEMQKFKRRRAKLNKDKSKKETQGLFDEIDLDITGDIRDQQSQQQSQQAQQNQLNGVNGANQSSFIRQMHDESEKRELEKLQNLFQKRGTSFTNSKAQQHKNLDQNQGLLDQSDLEEDQEYLTDNITDQYADKVNRYKEIQGKATQYASSNPNFKTEGIINKETQKQFEKEQNQRAIQASLENATHKAQKVEEQLNNILFSSKADQGKEVQFNTLDLIGDQLKKESKPLTREEMIKQMKEKQQKASGVVSIIDKLLPSQKIMLKRQQEAEKLKLRLKNLDQEEDKQENKDNQENQNQEIDELQKEANELNEGSHEHLQNQPEEEIDYIWDEEDQLVAGLLNSTYSALALFQKRGLIERKNQHAHNPNERKFNQQMEMMGVTQNDRVFFDRRDKYGNKQSQKDAFDEFCQQFHGKPASKRSQAKKKKKQDQLRQSAFQDPKKTKGYQITRKALAISDQPFINISKK